MKITFGSESDATPGKGASAHYLWESSAHIVVAPHLTAGREPSFERIAPVFEQDSLAGGLDLVFPTLYQGLTMSNFFYFDQHNQKLGPVTEEQLKELAAQGAITPQTPMETDTGHKGVAGQIPGMTFGTAAPNPFAQQPPPSPFSQRSQVPSASVTQSSGTSFTGDGLTVGGLNNLFWGYCGAVVMLHLLSLMFVFAGGEIEPSLRAILVPLVLVALFVMFWCTLIHSLWKLIPADIARTTPGKAAGFSLIPFFHCYWVFISILGLCKDMNKAFQQRGIRCHINEGLGTTYCIFFIAAYGTTIIWHEAPIFCFFVDTAGIVIAIILFKSLKDGAIALLEQGGQ